MGCSRSACARATPSRTSGGRRSSGRSSTSRSALIGAIGAPVYVNSSARTPSSSLEHSDAVAVLCEDDEQRAKVEPLGLSHVWTFAELGGCASAGAHTRARSPRR